jgi:tRNA(Ile)-lysidine synthase
MQIFEKFIKAIRDHRMLQRGERVLVGVSAGADSVALLHLLLGIRERYDLELIVGHLNHKLRGEESDCDEVFVRALADRCRLPCVSESVPAEERWRSQLGSLESWARQRRYEFFLRMSALYEVKKIALGHTIDDQAETVLMRLVRGSGTLGLGAIPFVRTGTFIRPMLLIKREEVLGFLTELQADYREDSSNLDEEFLRNRIRRELIPLLREKYNPRIVDLLSNTADILREDAEALEGLAEKILNEQGVITEAGIAWDLDRFLKLSRGMQKNVLRRSLLRIKGNLNSVSAKDVARLLDLAQQNKSGRHLRIGDVSVSREYRWLHLTRARAKRLKNGYQYQLQIPGRINLAETKSLFEASTEWDLHRASVVDHWEFYLSLEEVEAGVWIRNWRAGDAYFPVGASGVKKVKELFAQRKIPRHLRSTWPVVGIDDRIIFAKGFPVSADRSVKAACKRNLKVVIEERNLESETTSNLIQRRAD